MIQTTIDRLRERIEKSDALEHENKRQLVELLERLEHEIDSLSQADQEHAESIAGFTQASTHETLRKEKVPQLHKLSLEALQASVHGFENSHPRLVETVNSICVALTNLGI